MSRIAMTKSRLAILFSLAGLLLLTACRKGGETTSEPPPPPPQESGISIEKPGDSGDE